MTSPTPPPTTYDLKAAYDWRDAMVERADGLVNGTPAWNGWALVEAYMAGWQSFKEAMENDGQ